MAYLRRRNGEDRMGVGNVFIGQAAPWQTKRCQEASDVGLERELAHRSPYPARELVRDNPALLPQGKQVDGVWTQIHALLQRFAGSPFPAGLPTFRSDPIRKRRRRTSGEYEYRNQRSDDVVQTGDGSLAAGYWPEPPAPQPSGLPPLSCNQSRTSPQGLYAAEAALRDNRRCSGAHQPFFLRTL